MVKLATQTTCFDDDILGASHGGLSRWRIGLGQNDMPPPSYISLNCYEIAKWSLSKSFNSNSNYCNWGLQIMGFFSCLVICHLPHCSSFHLILKESLPDFKIAFLTHDNHNDRSLWKGCKFFVHIDDGITIDKCRKLKFVH
jgi:hypothetical protein